ncbi:two-component system sensor histidine kinase [Microlunatus lacustris]
MPVDTLLHELVGRAGELNVSRERLHHLMRANVEIVGEFSLALVLRHAVDSARELVDARYAALAVFDAEGNLEHFLHVGLDAETVAAIGGLPTFRGLLGGVLDDPRPIRLGDVAEDPRSTGYPRHHPEMTSFLGLPIHSGDEVFGTLYLTDREGGEFTAEDVELVTAFAATAGTAIEKARLHEQAQVRQRWLLASAEISGMLLAPDSGSDPLQVIIEKICELADADLATLVLPAEEPERFEVVVATGRGSDQLRGMRSSEENTMVEQAMTTGRGSRVDVVEDQHGFEGHVSRVAQVSPLMTVPLSGRRGAQGAIIVGRLSGRRGFTAADLELAEAFGIHAAIARELASARADQQRLSLMKDRSRIARDLHDHVIQRLFAAGLTMQSLTRIEGVPDLTDRLDCVIANIDATIRQIRTSIHQLESAESSPTDVTSVVLEIVDQLSPHLGFTPSVQFYGPLETVVAAAPTDAIAAVVREAVTNAAKHAEATALEVDLRLDGHQLTVDVSDDGVGLGANDEPRRSGLNNLERRADIWGGTLTLTANDPHGTRLVWTITIPG